MSTQAFETETQNTAVDLEAKPASIQPIQTPKNEESIDDKFQVVLEPQDDPKELPLIRKWLAVLTICNAALCTTFASSAVGLDSACPSVMSDDLNEL